MNTQKSTIFLKTCSEQSEKKIMKAISLIASKWTKYLGINVVNEMK